MFNSLFDSSTLPLLQKIAAFTERRQEVLAGNIANASTPEYQTRDLPLAEFQEKLKAAVAARVTSKQQSGAGPAEQWSFQQASQSDGIDQALPRELLQAIPVSGQFAFQDGNNRSVERDVMEMTKNSMMQSLAIELITSQINRLQAVISERP